MNVVDSWPLQVLPIFNLLVPVGPSFTISRVLTAEAGRVQFSPGGLPACSRVYTVMAEKRDLS